MRGYRLSFALSVLLFVGAFIALYGERTGNYPVPFSGSGVLALGAVVFSIIGQREYRK